LRAARVALRVVGSGVYQLALPETFTGSGLRDIPAESRRVETWGGFLCGDAHTMVAVNVTPLAVRSLADWVQARLTLFRDSVSPRAIVVAGSPRAELLKGLLPGDSPAEPQSMAMVFAVTGDELVTLSIRSWPRDDVALGVQRILDSFAIVARRSQ
jgi:hypothetical protein